MKKVLFTALAVASFAFAQAQSVAIVRHINIIAHKEVEQRLIVSRPGEKEEVIDLQQRYVDVGMTEKIGEDNQKIIEVFTSLLKEGYELESSNASSFNGMAAKAGFSMSSHLGAREIIYVFTKD